MDKQKCAAVRRDAAAAGVPSHWLLCVSQVCVAAFNVIVNFPRMEFVIHLVLVNLCAFVYCFARCLFV